MLVKERISITEEEFKECVNGGGIFIDRIMQKHNFNGYHPAGYGCLRETAVEDNGEYYVEWWRSNNCD